jgi:hypothetical protein
MTTLAPALRRVGSGWRSFRTWARQRPFVGGLLIALGGVELFFSGQLDLGNIHIQLGIEGLQATVIPAVLVVLGVVSALMPQHHVFYGVFALALALYAIVGVNLGGFFVGSLLAVIGGVLVVAYLPAKRATAVDPAESGEAEA